MTKDLRAPVLAHIDAGRDHSVESLTGVLRIPPRIKPMVRKERAGAVRQVALMECGGLPAPQ